MSESSDEESETDQEDAIDTVQQSYSIPTVHQETGKQPQKIAVVKKDSESEFSDDENTKPLAKTTIPIPDRKNKDSESELSDDEDTKPLAKATIPIPDRKELKDSESEEEIPTDDDTIDQGESKNFLSELSSKIGGNLGAIPKKPKTKIENQNEVIQNEKSKRVPTHVQSKSIKKDIQEDAKSIQSTTSSVKSKSLFDSSDSEDDLFGGKSTLPKKAAPPLPPVKVIPEKEAEKLPEKSTSQVAKKLPEKPQSKPSLFDDLSDDDEDIVPRNIPNKPVINEPPKKSVSKLFDDSSEDDEMDALFVKKAVTKTEVKTSLFEDSSDENNSDTDSNTKEAFNDANDHDSKETDDNDDDVDGLMSRMKMSRAYKVIERKLSHKKDSESIENDLPRQQHTDQDVSIDQVTKSDISKDDIHENPSIQNVSLNIGSKITSALQNQLNFGSKPTKSDDPKPSEEAKAAKNIDHNIKESSALIDTEVFQIVPENQDQSGTDRVNIMNPKYFITLE